MKLTFIIVIAIVLPIIILITYIRYKLRDFSRKIFGTNSLIDGYKNQKELLSETPKSICAMTSVYLPLIQRDFPEFNYEEFKVKAENMLKSALVSISNGNVGLFINALENLINSVSLIISNNKSLRQIEYYKDITIYKTGITDYKKQSGTCVITLQSAISYLHYIKKDGNIVEGSSELTEQCLYNVDIVYIQDKTKMDSDISTSIGTNCPNCGAPITSLGEKYCSYCGTMVRVVNVKVWSINKYQKL